MILSSPFILEFILEAENNHNNNIAQKKPI